MKAIRALTFFVLTMMILSHASATGADFQAQRPATWAQPILVKGVNNLHRVSEELYRSAQPTAEGMKNLKKIGVKTIVSLRSFHSDRNGVASAGLAYEHIHMKAWHPEENEIVRFLQIVTNPRRTPVLVHCQLGADRTGTMCAIYRIVIQGWTKEEALEEMTQGGFGFHGVWSNLTQWINELDIGKIKSQLGLSSPSSVMMNLPNDIEVNMR